MRPPSTATVRNVVAVSVVLTAFHFADNFFSIDTYPAPDWQPGWFEWVVLAGWLAFTAVGVAAHRLYRAGDHARAHVGLVVYSYAGLISLGHFLYGPPSEFTTRALVSIGIDAIAGSAVLAVAIASIAARRRAPTAAA